MTTVHLENSHFSNAGDFSTPTASHTDSSDPTSQPEPPPGLKADINTMLEWMYDPTQRGKLQQLIRGRARDLDKAVNALELPSNGLDQTALLSHYDSLYKLSAPIVELLQQGVSHDREGSHADVWSGALQQMMRIRRPAVMPAGQMIQRLPPERFSRARHVPAMLTLRTIGLTAVLASRDHPGTDKPTRLWMELGRLPWRDPDAGRRGTTTGLRTTLDLLDEHEVLDPSAVHDHIGQKFSMSRYIRTLLHPVFEEVCLDDTEWQDLNDQFEYRRALLYARAEQPIPPMLASGERRWSSGGWQPELHFLDEVDLENPDSPWAATDMGEPMIGEKHLEIVRQAARRQLPH